VLLSDAKALENITVVAINIGPDQSEFVPHMFKYDTLMGTYPAPVRLEDEFLVVDDHRIKLFTLCNAPFPWKELSIDWVVDASGKYTAREQAQKHCDSGARHVLITAPAKGDDVTIIPGVNSQMFDAKKHTIVSLGSCTTNAFMPLLKVMHDTFGITKGFMTTVHAYTASQVLLDNQAKDLRLSRAAALNIIPTTTGAAGMIARVIPELKDIIKASSMRVPVAKVSIMDIALVLKKVATTKQVNDAFVLASQSTLKNIMQVSFEPLVSSDYSMANYSVIVDGLLTDTVDNLVKVFGWYDNEWGYSERLKDFLLMAKK